MGKLTYLGNFVKIYLLPPILGFAFMLIIVLIFNSWINTFTNSILVTNSSNQNTNYAPVNSGPVSDIKLVYGDYSVNIELHMINNTSYNDLEFHHGKFGNFYALTTEDRKYGLYNKSSDTDILKGDTSDISLSLSYYGNPPIIKDILVFPSNISKGWVVHVPSDLVRSALESYKQKKAQSNFEKSVATLTQDESNIKDLSFTSNINEMELDYATMSNDYETLQKDASANPLTSYQLNVVNDDLNTVNDDLSALNDNLNSTLSDINLANDKISDINNDINAVEAAYQKYKNFNMNNNSAIDNNISSIIKNAQATINTASAKIASAQQQANSIYAQGKQLYKTAEEYVAGLRSSDN